MNLVNVTSSKNFRLLESTMFLLGQIIAAKCVGATERIAKEIGVEKELSRSRVVRCEVRVLVGALLVTSLVSSALSDELSSKATIEIPPQENFHLYLLIGQSNMVGRDKPRQQDKQTHPRILMLDADLSWVAVADPLPHEDSGRSVGVGPGMSFARIMVERDESITIGLVASAWGGTPIKRWIHGADLYGKAIMRARAAQKFGTLKGVLWQQDESDSYTKPLARSYKAKFVKLIHDLREDLSTRKLPLVTGEIGQFRHPKFEHCQIINNALIDIAKEVPHVGFVQVAGLRHIGDFAHIDASSQRRMGKAFAAEMIRVQQMIDK